jgi:hypothetical protein
MLLKKNLIRCWVLGLAFCMMGAASVATPASSPVVLDLSAKIYLKDQFPANCQNIFVGADCPQVSFGRFHAVSEKQSEPNSYYHRSTFADAQGIQVIEETWEKDQKMIKGKIENKQTKTVDQLEVKDGRVYYQSTLADGTIKKSDDSLDDNLVMPSTLMSYIRPRFDDLLAGKSFQVKMAVLDRRESFTFNVKKVKDGKTLAGDPMVVLEMTAASIFIKAFVNAIRFHINSRTGELVAFEGRSALKQNVNGKLKDIDVQNFYEYKVNQFERTKNEKKL